MVVNPIPESYQRVTPYLLVDGAAGEIDFLVAAFDAEERGERMPGPNDTIGHAEVNVGDSVIMLADAGEQFPATRALSLVYVENVDATYERAMAAGATSDQEPETQFYGDRTANITDPFGQRWTIASHVEEVPPDEMGRRVQALLEQAQDA
ncbi:MAG TPA: VOC family protein [Actinomycetota bacterium]|nr:VOC family protein [Actinomycetota bacterium]